MYNFYKIERVFLNFLSDKERRCGMTVSDAQKKASINYAKRSIKRIPLDVQKEKYEEIKEAATAAGQTVNGYIKKAIDERMERDSYGE